MANQEAVQVQESVTATIVRSRPLPCPGCGAVRFQRLDWVEIDQDGTENIALTDYRCIECSRVWSRDQIR